jgi:hypothetical protein
MASTRQVRMGWSCVSAMTGGDEDSLPKAAAKQLESTGDRSLLKGERSAGVGCR